jgi:hypothetical protein
MARMPERIATSGQFGAHIDFKIIRTRWVTPLTDARASK